MHFLLSLLIIAQALIAVASDCDDSFSNLDRKSKIEEIRKELIRARLAWQKKKLDGTPKALLDKWDQALREREKELSKLLANTGLEPIAGSKPSLIYQPKKEAPRELTPPEGPVSDISFFREVKFDHLVHLNSLGYRPILSPSFKNVAYLDESGRVHVDDLRTGNQISVSRELEIEYITAVTDHLHPKVISDDPINIRGYSVVIQNEKTDSTNFGPLSKTESVLSLMGFEDLLIVHGQTKLLRWSPGSGKDPHPYYRFQLPLVDPFQTHRVSEDGKYLISTTKKKIIVTTYTPKYKKWSIPLADFVGKKILEEGSFICDVQIASDTLFVKLCGGILLLDHVYEYSLTYKSPATNWPQGGPILRSHELSKVDYEKRLSVKYHQVDGSLLFGPTLWLANLESGQNFQTIELSSKMIRPPEIRKRGSFVLVYTENGTQVFQRKDGVIEDEDPID